MRGDPHASCMHHASEEIKSPPCHLFSHPPSQSPLHIHILCVCEAPQIHKEGVRVSFIRRPASLEPPITASGSQLTGLEACGSAGSRFVRGGGG